jgi:hypothetical protein
VSARDIYFDRWWLRSFCGNILTGLPRRWRSGLSLSAVAWATLVLGVVGQVRAQTEEAGEINREYAIKAAYLYQFGRYVKWPERSFADRNSPLVIGVLGNDPFVGLLDEIARTKRLDGRPIVIRRFASMAQYTPCHILFVPASVGAAEEAAAIRRLRGGPTLLVGEEPGFAEQGGTVNFFPEENKIRFEINTDAAREGQLKISSKLLSLAKIVGTLSR